MSVCLSFFVFNSVFSPNKWENLNTFSSADLFASYLIGCVSVWYEMIFYRKVSPQKLINYFGEGFLQPTKFNYPPPSHFKIKKVKNFHYKFSEWIESLCRVLIYIIHL